jgi:uncharacterized protein YecT (DUF1311 family)
MKCISLPLFGALFLSLVSPAHALECAKATSPVEKLICATPELKKADTAMSAAYFKLLRQTTDRDFHEALLRSQRRWLKAREEAFKTDRAQEDDDTDVNRNALLQVTRDRLEFLQTSKPLRVLQQQRRATSKDSGGIFAGYRSNCTFLPPRYGNWTYICLGEAHRQHNDRICSVGVDWASGHMTDYRLVLILKSGQPRSLASCSYGYAGTREQCPDPTDNAETKASSHWNTNPQPNDTTPLPRADGLWKYDPDVDPGLTQEPWINDCLFASAYPPPEISRFDPAPSK